MGALLLCTSFIRIGVEMLLTTMIFFSVVFFAFSPIAFLPHMVQRKSGLIVVISSVAGKVPIPLRASFAASKHALQAFSDALRAEMAIHHINVLVSSPEYVPSDVTTAENDEIAEPEDKKKGKLDFFRPFALS